jgi:hypothetical protein
MSISAEVIEKFYQHRFSSDEAGGSDFVFDFNCPAMPLILRI